MATLQYVVRAADDASATFTKIAASADRLNEDLNKLDGKTATATAKLEDKQLKFELDDIELKMARLDKRVTTTHMNDDQIARARHEAERLSLALDKLNAKRTKIHVDSSALNKLGGAAFLQPSAIGTALSLLPALIPLSAEVAAGAVAIGVSFGAAAIATAGFGLMASTVLQGASKDLAKLQALNLALNKATTAKQKKAVEQQIHDLKAGWAKGYLDLIDNYQQFQAKWKSISQAITVPTLNVWLPVLTKGLQFLKPLIKPVADAFTLWGISLNTYFKDPATARHIKDMAAAFGNFAAQQLFRIGQFIKDIAQGVFNLGKDLAASGANFSAFGPWLSGIGDGFLTWSKSKNARADVHGFMKFIHDEGPVVKGILRDLGKLLPGIFAGATTIGTLELQALGGFLNLVASLPKGWQKPITEFAGAMLLLSKTGVIKVGLKMTGWSLAGQAAGGAAEGAAAGGTLSALQRSTGLKWIFRAGIAVAIAELIVKPALQSTSSGKGKNWWDNPFGTDKGKGALNSWTTLWHDIEHIFDVGRHFVAASWDRTWQDTIGKAIRAGATLRHDIASTGHDIAHTWDVLRHGIAATWDTIWRNTVTRTQHGIDDLMNWFRTIPGRAVGALRGFGHGLAAFASAAFHEMLNAIRNVAGTIWGWLRHWVSSIPGFLKKILGISSPSSVFYDIGKQMMMGLFHGIQDHAHHAANAARSAAGGGFMDTGARSGNAFLAQQYAAAQLSRFGWGRTQFGPLLALWNQESGWNAYAVNPSSGAYGIPQSLGHGHPYNLGDYKAQIIWGLNYIAQRYGSPGGAWAHEQAFNWYGSGLSGGIFNRPTLIGVGERGTERVDITPAGQGRRGGPLLHIEHLHVREAADVDLLARRLAFLDA